MGIVSTIQYAVSTGIKKLYGHDLPPEEIVINETKPEFEGDYTVVLFGFMKTLRKSPEDLGKSLGEEMKNSNQELISGFNVIKGFLNLTISDQYWVHFLYSNYFNTAYGQKLKSTNRVMVEYSSPNTNKPLHLGHLRNNFLGWSISEIFKANGFDVIKTCMVNDRGIHICKSMLAWQKFGNGATPATSGIKGDHLVGDYYVAFERELRIQSEPLMQKVLNNEVKIFTGEDKTRILSLLDKLKELKNNEEKINEIKEEIREIVRNNTPIMKEVRELLLKWENHDADTIQLWKQMNGWVYEGFEATYKAIGSDFDKIYYESETYLLGKQIVEEGLEKGVFTKKEDGSVWIDLTADGLDEKLLLRNDGTSVYITQDLGLAKLKYDDYKMNESIYVVGDEQNYHMKVLKLICQKLQIPNADNIHHLSYGMVDLPSGRMKSREGTVVDADDLVKEMESISAKHTLELGKVKDFREDELEQLYHTIGLGALKFFLLRVDPKKRMVFNPEDSIDFHGFTGPFIQYTYARTKSILRKEEPMNELINGPVLLPEKKMIIELEKYHAVIEQACTEMNPSVIANYVFKVAQAFNSFVTDLRILSAESAEKKELRLQLAKMTAHVIQSAMDLLGIQVPERM